MTKKHDLKGACLDDTCDCLAGVGNKIAETLRKMGVTRLRDVLLHFPTRYEDRSRVSRLCDLQAGQWVGAIVTVASVKLVTHGRRQLRVLASNESGQLLLCFFNCQTIRRQFVTGKQLYCYGEVCWLG